MSPFSSEEFAAKMIRSMRIIIAALAMGIVAFAGIVITFGGPKQNQTPEIAYLAIALTAVVLGARTVVPGVMVSSQRKQIANGTWGGRGAVQSLPPGGNDADRLLFVFMHKSIVQGALLEGPAFFLLIAFLTTRAWWLFAVVAALLVLLILQFPTRFAVENWVSDQLQLLETEKPS